MKLVTFNIRSAFAQDGINSFEYRKPLIMNKIKAEQPDIICFQEVVPFVAAWMKETLTDYYVIGCGRDEKLEGEQMTIVYNKLRYNLMGLEMFWLSETPSVPGSRYEDQSDCPRICTQALFQDLETKDIFRLYNTHLDHIGSGARKLGLGQILRKMQKDAQEDKLPAILTGDFNALPDSPEMKLMNDYPQYIDMTSEITSTFHNYGTQKEEEKIDYIFAQDCYRLLSATIWEDQKDGVYLSDHYPVCVEMVK